MSSASAHSSLHATPAPLSRMTRSGSNARSPNKANLPSLKQVADRLHANSPGSAASSGSASGTSASVRSHGPTSAGDNTSSGSNLALSEIITNVPTANSDTQMTPSRLKLPASAITRANLSPSPARASTEVARASATVPTPGSGKKHDEGLAGTSASSTAPDLVPDTKETTLRGLGMGIPVSSHFGSSVLATPTKSSIPKDTAVPEIVVLGGTPDRDESKKDAHDRLGKGPGPNGEHPLAHEWTLFYDSKSYKPQPPATQPSRVLNEWEASLLTVGNVANVEAFARLMNNVRLPGSLAKGSNYHLFKDGIRPMWEDPANHNGGKWVLMIRGNPNASAMLDQMWSNLVLALVGQMLDPDNLVCGIVVSSRHKMDRIQVWTRSREDAAVLNTLGNRIVETVALDQRELDHVSLEFQSNQKDTGAVQGKFMRIPFARSFPTSAATAPNSPNPVLESPRLESPRLRSRAPNSPLGTHSSLPVNPLATTNGLGLGSPVSTPMRRSGSGAFMGPMGTSRRLVSNPENAG